MKKNGKEKNNPEAGKNAQQNLILFTIPTFFRRF
jgi:hypothetical protein